MFTVAALVLAAAVGALAFRIRGGMLGDRWGVRGQASRAIYAALMAGIVMCSGNPWPVDDWRLALFGLALVAAYFAGAALWGTFHSIDAGRVDGDARTEFWLNAARGALYALPPAIVLAALRLAHDGAPNAWAAGLMPLFGLLQSISYEVSWRLRPVERKPTELAEVLTGAALGLGGASAAAFGSA